MRSKTNIMMDYDISEPISQGSDEAQEAENRRIAEIADELRRLCRVHETQFGACKGDVSTFETEQKSFITELLRADTCDTWRF